MIKKYEKIYKLATLWLKSLEYDNDKIMEELGIDESDLKTLLEDTSSKKKEKNESTIKKLMTASTTNKNNKITVMSKEASEISDSIKHNKTKKSRDTSAFIFKPNSK